MTAPDRRDHVAVSRYEKRAPKRPRPLAGELAAPLTNGARMIAEG